MATLSRKNLNLFIFNLIFIEAQFRIRSFWCLVELISPRNLHEISSPNKRMIVKASNKLQLIDQPLFVSQMSQKKIAVSKTHFNVKWWKLGVWDFWYLNFSFVSFWLFCGIENKHRRRLKDSPFDSKKCWPDVISNWDWPKKIDVQLLFQKNTRIFSLIACKHRKLIEIY